ncbi:uncharacterized protein PSFLO_05298 [Pseudozyma flocculosa]|uniref:Pentacotripeptide-repeat region of PRORP domain-containing protein n=1 Tax=Pseudozyma flocculosa TaxID=84751 RepID=A0A5C3F7X4_9BASI|nr:uncharacterized protein PSFLO_05298 [Pseudozyma flocculosa]
MLCPLPIANPASSSAAAAPRQLQQRRLASTSATGQSPSSSAEGLAEGLYEGDGRDQPIEAEGRQQLGAAAVAAEAAASASPEPGPSTEGPHDHLDDARWEAETEPLDFDPQAAKRLEHWIAPLQPSSSGVDPQVNARRYDALNRALDELPTLPKKHHHDLRERLSDALSKVWSAYRSICHMERMPLSLRVRTARAIVRTTRLIKSHRQSFPKILTVSNKQGRRLTAIVRDCHFFTRYAQRTQPSDRYQFAIDNFEVQAKALLGEEIMARKQLVTVMEPYKDSLLAVLKDYVPIGVHLPEEVATDLVESMCAILDAMIARDQNARFRAAKLQEHPVEELKPSVGLVPSEPVNAGERAKPAPSRQASMLVWLLKNPHAFALVNSRSVKHAGARFGEFMSAVDDPVEMLEKAIGDADWASLGPSTAATQLMLAFFHSSVNLTAIDVYRNATRRGARIDEAAARYALRLSVFQEDTVTTEALIRLITQNMARAAKLGWRENRHLSPSTIATIAMFRARHAQIEKMEQSLAELERQAPDPDYARNVARQARLESIIARGDLQGCRAEMAKVYDVDGLGAESDAPSAKARPDRAYFFSLLRCCNNADDVESAVKCWEEMLEADVVPDVLMLNSLLELYARGSDVDSALQLFESMREWGVRPDAYTYTILVHLFALRRDTEGAIHAVKAMVADRVEPNVVTWTALLNAYVESSSWDATIGLFRWMQNNPKRSLRPSVATYNTLLKAYVKRAIPIQTVMSTATDMRRLGIEWNEYTFALVLQSACDAGLMIIAEEIFTQAEARLPPPPGLRAGQGANLYHFTIMINGYLRWGNNEEAKEYFNELQDRGIEPSAITWSAIVSSYANSDNEDNFHLARTLVTQLVSDEVVRGLQRPKWKSPAVRQGPPYENMFMPLLVAHGRRGEIDEAEETADSLMSTGSGLSLYTLTALLDAYRRAGEVDKAMQLYDTMYEQVLRDTNIDLSRMFTDAEDLREQMQTQRDGSRRPGFSLETSHNVDPARRSMLCMPISIMIQLLSAAGRHDEIAQIWSRAKRDGFAFDPHNWNNLATAMARAGQLEEAMMVIERVLHHPVPDYRGRKSRDDRFRTIAPEEFDDDEDIEQGSEHRSEHSIRFSQEDDPLSMKDLYPSYLYNGEDRTASPANPPNRRHEYRFRDDPHTPLPFDPNEDVKLEDGGATDGQASNAASPSSAKSRRERERETQRRAAAVRNMTQHLYDHNAFEMTLNPWFAHFETLQVVTDELDRLRFGEGQVGWRTANTLLTKHKVAAHILAQHRKKVEAIEEAKRLKAQRSAGRDLSRSA